jgi:hypothetical protein
MKLSVVALLIASACTLTVADGMPSATENFEEADTDRDGAVSLEEFKKYLAADHPANKAVGCLASHFDSLP